MAKKTKSYDPLTKCPLCGTYVPKSTLIPPFAGSVEVCVPCHKAWNSQKD